MDPRTVRKIDQEQELPKSSGHRNYRTRLDPLEPFRQEIDRLLEQDHGLKAYAIFQEMRTRYPDTFSSTWRRSLERYVRNWRIEHRIEREVRFDQEHLPGDVLAIDFSRMNDLQVSIAGERFEHLIFHAVLTYSNWEYVEVCFSESFEAVAQGLQNAYLEIGGVTHRLRFDSMSAAVNNLSTDRQFRTNFRRLIEHFGVRSHRINVRAPEENGDCESAHRHFKDYVDQRLFATIAPKLAQEGKDFGSSSDPVGWVFRWAVDR